MCNRKINHQYFSFSLHLGSLLHSVLSCTERWLFPVLQLWGLNQQWLVSFQWFICGLALYILCDNGLWNTLSYYVLISIGCSVLIWLCVACWNGSSAGIIAGSYRIVRVSVSGFCRGVVNADGVGKNCIFRHPRLLPLRDAIPPKICVHPSE